VPSDRGGERLDVIVAALATVSRRAARRLIDDGSVFVEGTRVRVASRIVRAGNNIQVELGHAHQANAPAAILHQDDDVIVIDKPAGMPTEPTRQASVGTALEEIRRHLRASGAPLHFLAAAHRLDVDTSGVLVFALSSEAAGVLGNAFATGKVDRRYLALVRGHAPLVVTRVDAPLVELEPGRFGVGEGGSESLTLVRGIAHGDDVTLALCTPLTGRTHQIRVHLQHLGHPLIGDRRYGTVVDEGGLGLHAVRLQVPQPTTGKALRIVSPPPAAFVDACLRSGISREILDAAVAALDDAPEATVTTSADAPADAPGVATEDAS
jgi:23S rRNA pseudouridine1911/1915/1917 synthase